MPKWRGNSGDDLSNKGTTRVDPVAQILFAYLHDLIYNPSRATLDMASLPPSFHTVGEGLQYFATCLLETRNFAKALSKGDLTSAVPSIGNDLAAPLKTLHAALKHLSWQTQQVAKGDYQQRVDFMGDFSTDFNSMVEQLEQRRRRDAEAACKLQETAYWYESILDAVPFPVFVQDADMKCRFVNATAEKVLGKKRTDILGLSCNTWGFSICNTDKCSIACAKCGQKQTYFAHEGASYQVDVALLRGIQNEFSGFIEVIQDITQLELMAKERSDAEAASQAKSAFLARMSHEIRTPMNAILGLTEMQMHDTTLSRERKEAFDRIYAAGYTLLGIINDLLDLSKIEAGKMELLPVDYEVASLISDAVQVNLMRIGSKAIAFRLELDEDMPSELFGDELRIRQILNNLLSNAFKYTHNGEVTLSIFAEYGGSEDENAPVTLVCRVRDTGQGMTEEQVRSLFDEYTRFSLEANRTIEGSGLGMSIARQLVELMNGEIFVESTLGMGSTFTVRLPQGRTGDGKLGRKMVESLQQFKSGTPYMKAPQIVREPMPYGSVLIVDDLETNLYVSKGLMTPYGLSLDTALSGVEAIDKIRSGKEYNIVFMDHMMPNMDGVEAVKILRDLGYTRSIVALTANAVAGQAEMFLESGFDGFLSKPIDLRQLNILLNKLVRDTQPPEVIEAARRQQNDADVRALRVSVDPQLASIFIRDAEKTLVTLEALHANQYRRKDDGRMFVITVHAIKSALANIGETELAALAYTLEQAGRTEDTVVMLGVTPIFMEALRGVIGKIMPAEEDEAGKTADEDPAYLREKLSVIQAACAAYDSKAARDALAELQQKVWPRPIREQLHAVARHLLHSEFEEAAEYCGRMLSGTEAQAMS